MIKVIGIEPGGLYIQTAETCHALLSLSKLNGRKNIYELSNTMALNSILPNLSIGTVGLVGFVVWIIYVVFFTAKRGRDFPDGELSTVSIVIRH